MVKRKNKLSSGSNVVPGAPPQIDPKYEKRYDKLKDLKGSLADEKIVSRPPDMGRPKKFALVKPKPQKPVITKLPPVETNVVYDITPNAQQIIKLETSGVDRAKGFHIMITPMAWMAGLVVLVMAIFFKNVEIWSLLALLIFSLSTLACYLIAWAITLLVSPEVVSFYEALRKWNHVDRDQAERHRYYRGDK